MKVQAVKSFVSKVGDKKYRIEQDWKGDLPEGADWLGAGFVVPVKEQEIETATKAPKEKAVTRAKKLTKKAVDKVMKTGKKK
jgi:hypothetical protein